MGVFDWSRQAAANETADPDVPARDGASARDLPGLIRGLMAAMAALASDQGGAIRTSGLRNAYVARTASGVTAVRPGIALVVQADRDNGGAATLNVDGLGYRPWRDLDGSVPVPGRIRRDAFYTVFASGDGWVSDFGSTARAEAEDASITAALIFGGI